MTGGIDAVRRIMSGGVDVDLPEPNHAERTVPTSKGRSTAPGRQFTGEQAKPSEASVEHLLFHFKTLARKAPSEWDRKFARSILRCAKRPEWSPSPRQLYVMRQMVAAMFDSETIDLIETDEGGSNSGA